VDGRYGTSETCGLRGLLMLGSSSRNECTRRIANNPGGSRGWEKAVEKGWGIDPAAFAIPRERIQAERQCCSPAAMQGTGGSPAAGNRWLGANGACWVAGQKGRGGRALVCVTCRAGGTTAVNCGLGDEKNES
jgi:hypothetical protein